MQNAAAVIAAFCNLHIGALRVPKPSTVALPSPVTDIIGRPLAGPHVSANEISRPARAMYRRSIFSVIADPQHFFFPKKKKKLFPGGGHGSKGRKARVWAAHFRYDQGVHCGLPCVVCGCPCRALRTASARDGASIYNDGILQARIRRQAASLLPARTGLGGGGSRG